MLGSGGICFREARNGFLISRSQPAHFVLTFPWHLCKWRDVAYAALSPVFRIPWGTIISVPSPSSTTTAGTSRLGCIIQRPGLIKRPGVKLWSHLPASQLHTLCEPLVSSTGCPKPWQPLTALSSKANKAGKPWLWNGGESKIQILCTQWSKMVQTFRQTPELESHHPCGILGDFYLSWASVSSAVKWE